jgi:hypothetical protein
MRDGGTAVHAAAAAAVQAFCLTQNGNLEPLTNRDRRGFRLATGEQVLLDQQVQRHVALDALALRDARAHVDVGALEVDAGAGPALVLFVWVGGREGYGG